MWGTHGRRSCAAMPGHALRAGATEPSALALQVHHTPTPTLDTTPHCLHTAPRQGGRARAQPPPPHHRRHATPRIAPHPIPPYPDELVQPQHVPHRHHKGRREACPPQPQPHQRAQPGPLLRAAPQEAQRVPGRSASLGMAAVDALDHVERVLRVLGRRWLPGRWGTAAGARRRGGLASVRPTAVWPAALLMAAPTVGIPLSRRRGGAWP